jgi:nucleotide-binding universal stress UspA family protein
MYRRVMLPLDGSDLAKQALRHAIMLATAGSSEVVLLQVIDSEAQIIAQTTPATIEPIPAGRITAEVAHEAVEGQRQAAVANLQSAEADLKAAGIERVVAEIVEGPPGEAIADAAQRLGCDVIVMATHGRSGLRRAILGSVADHVVRHTPTSAVLLVKPDAEPVD